MKFLEEILEELVPSTKEKRELFELANKVLGELKMRCEERGIEATPTLQGSVAKDTWLSGDRDLDIFLIFSPKYSKEEMERLALDVSKLYEHEIAFAEHPYVRNFYENFRIDVVPCFELTQNLKTSVDRTPLHTKYVLKNLKNPNEVRLLKRFLKAKRLYGAELKTMGFSGYLCELLIIHYGSFLECLKAASNWKYGTLIDLEKRGVRGFREPLLVIDPVDSKRNVAAALSLQNFASFIYHSRRFLEEPRKKWFYRSREKYVKIKGSKVFVITFKANLIDDILFPQLRKTQAYLSEVLEKNDFRVYKTRVFNSGILFELSVFKLPEKKKHKGPRIYHLESCKRFYDKHEKISIEGDRLIAEIERKYKRK
ncbi:MAG: CCA tRNA nucleotidyltransferase, partial [Candidatus Methanofastidiosia archaeon]